MDKFSVVIRTNRRVESIRLHAKDWLTACKDAVADQTLLNSADEVESFWATNLRTGYGKSFTAKEYIRELKRAQRKDDDDLPF